jgi:hypothetical protein
MTFALSALISIGPVALVAALVSIVIYYFKYRYAPKQHRSVLQYGLIALGVGALAYVIGAVVAVLVACSSASAGNLCGLVGVLGVGPLLAAAAIFVSTLFWAKNARRAT